MSVESSLLKPTANDVVEKNKLISFTYKLNGHWWTNPDILAKDCVPPPLDEAQEEEANMKATHDEQEEPSVPSFNRQRQRRLISHFEFQIKSLIRWKGKRKNMPILEFMWKISEELN